MQSCPCGAAAADESRFCPECGAPFVPDAETRLATTPATRGRSTPVTGSAAPDARFDHGRFVPGSMLAGRYRVLGRIGRGGMGEVYRADDLKLGQQVALKFLPEEMSRDAARLSQFHAEVRLARQVSHPNVCRVYDIDEDDGRTFLSMEYIDGEDLGSLLRRIGRLPQDKALELSRQLCAGLAAAHERGVIHRDLKPANLMIDSEGRLRIADFGIAALSATGGPTAGTPGYMAPELLAGAPADVRTDVYALGLVLYELFTGKRAFGQGSIADVVRAQQDTHPAAPTTHVRDLDPAIERVILRCLQRDRDHRPSSALAVSAQLPGGDPFAAALAAGETPSPQMVAAAGEAAALPPWRGVTLVLAAAVALILVLFIADRTYLVNLVTLEKPPAVLADRAVGLLASVGYNANVSRADGFVTSTDYLQYVAANNQRSDRWTLLRDTRGPSISYWFRVSPRALAPMNVGTRVTLHDPPMNISGQAGVILDPRGRLIEMHGVPPQYDETIAPPVSADWKPLFDAAALDMVRFAPAEPRWTPRSFADVRVAWTGSAPEHPGVTLRVEAASYRGRPVFFALTGPWTKPTRMIERPRSRAESVLSFVSRSILVAVFAGSALLAWRNTRRGRGDRQGAAFAATTMFACSFVARLLGMSHVPDPTLESERFFIVGIAVALFDAGTLWVMYMAVEPAVRRFWPDSLMGWTRLVSGHVRDARVGRDILYGVVTGLVLAVIAIGHSLFVPLTGSPPPAPLTDDLSVWLGAHMAAASTLFIGRNAFQIAGITLFLVVLLRMVLRSRVAAAAAAVLVFTAFNLTQVAGSETPVLDIVFTGCLVSGIVAVVVRFGLLTTLVMFFVYFLMSNLPLTSSFAAWYGFTSAWAIFLTLALAATGFWLSRSGAPLFGGTLLDD